MKSIIVKSNKARSVVYSSRVVNQAFDATEIQSIEIVRNDGEQFTLTEFFGDWEFSHGSVRLAYTSNEVIIESLMRLHSLPSLAHILETVQICVEEWIEDPMTAHYGGMSSIV